MMLEVGDRLEIHELLARVGHIIDDQEWERLPEVLAEDFVSDATAVGHPRCEGLPAVVESWSNPRRRADGHHGTNIVLTELGESTVRAISKGLSVYGGSESHTLVHEDVIVRTADGWRIAKRVTRFRKTHPTDAR
jgi:SnoaL-like domain